MNKDIQFFLNYKENIDIFIIFVFVLNYVFNRTITKKNFIYLFILYLSSEFKYRNRCAY